MNLVLKIQLLIINLLNSQKDVKERSLVYYINRTEQSIHRDLNLLYMHSPLFRIRGRPRQSEWATKLVDLMVARKYRYS